MLLVTIPSKHFEPKHFFLKYCFTSSSLLFSTNSTSYQINSILCDLSYHYSIAEFLNLNWNSICWVCFENFKPSKPFSLHSSFGCNHSDHCHVHFPAAFSSSNCPFYCCTRFSVTIYFPSNFQILMTSQTFMVIANFPETFPASFPIMSSWHGHCQCLSPLPTLFNFPVKVMNIRLWFLLASHCESYQWWFITQVRMVI